ncbi:hypothetical protein K502DRAFT_351958 [Neoconidiobolus thromboides FSU 785]|nr:hypothetical protein K502DRAFT_351958 [Neoconidiobolus thromboides FSU 785]
MGVSRLMPSGLICISSTENYDSIEHKIYATVVFVIIYPIALCIPIFYGLISIHYYKLNQRFKECSGSLRQRVAFYKSKHIACLFLFTMLYLICMFPEFIILVIEAASYYQRSYTVDCISFLLFYSGAVVNPLFVLTLLPDSRKKLVKLFKKERNGDGHHQTVSAFQYPLSNDLIGRTPLPIS